MWRNKIEKWINWCNDNLSSMKYIGWFWTILLFPFYVIGAMLIHVPRENYNDYDDIDYKKQQLKKNEKELKKIKTIEQINKDNEKSEIDILLEKEEEILKKQEQNYIKENNLDSYSPIEEYKDYLK